MQVIYRYLCENFKWNGSYAINVPKTLNDCFDKKEGNTAELNLLLLALLKANDIEAYPMLLSTRSNGYPMQVYPILEQFDYLVVLAQIGDETFLFDVHDEAYPVNYLRENALNGAAWLMTEKPQWVNLTPPISKTTIYGNFQLDAEGAATGKIQLKLEGYDAIDERQAIRKYTKGEHWEKRMLKYHPTVQVNGVELRNSDKPDKPASVVIDCEIPGLSQVNGDFIYVPPIAIPAMQENPLKAETRKFPVEMLYPRAEKYIFSYTLPEGYAVEELPEAALVTLPNNGGIIKYQASDSGGKVQVVMSVKINQIVYPKEEYQHIRNFFNLLLEKQNEQIILKKGT